MDEDNKNEHVSIAEDSDENNNENNNSNMGKKIATDLDDDIDIDIDLSMKISSDCKNSSENSDVNDASDDNENDEENDKENKNENGNNNNNNSKGEGDEELENKREEGEMIFADACTRVLKENHCRPIQNIKVCPYENCSNLLGSAGGNQISVYDCTHRGNFMDLVCNFFNMPTHIDDLGNALDLEQLSKQDTSHYNGKNPSALDASMLDDTPWKDKEYVLTDDDVTAIQFNDLSWLNRLYQQDLFIVGACNDGNIYVISEGHAHCFKVFPGSKYPIKSVVSHCSEPYWSNVIATIDGKNNAKLWDIEGIDCRKFQYDFNGGLLKGQTQECLVAIKDLLSCLLFCPTYQDKTNNSSLIYGFTTDNKLKGYCLNHRNETIVDMDVDNDPPSNASNSSSNDNKNGNEQKVNENDKNDADADDDDDEEEEDDSDIDSDEDEEEMSMRMRSKRKRRRRRPRNNRQNGDNDNGDNDDGGSNSNGNVSNGNDAAPASESVPVTRPRDIRMAKKWTYKVIFDEKIEYTSEKNNIRKTEHLRNVRCMRWRPNGKDNEYENQLLLVDDKAKFWLYDVEKKSVIHRFSVYGGIDLNDEDKWGLPLNYSFDFSKNGRYIVYGNEDGEVHIYDLELKRNIKELEPDLNRQLRPVYHCRFAEPNEESIVSVSDWVLWKYDTDEWVEDYRDMATYYDNPLPFSEATKADPTYVQFD